MHLPNPTEPDYPEICTRWHQATVCNQIMSWEAIVSWLAAESMLATIDDLPQRAADMATLSDLAHQHALDLYPQMQMEAA